LVAILQLLAEWRLQVCTVWTLLALLLVLLLLVLLLLLLLLVLLFKHALLDSLVLPLLLLVLLLVLLLILLLLLLLLLLLVLPFKHALLVSLVLPLLLQWPQQPPLLHQHLQCWLQEMLGILQAAGSAHPLNVLLQQLLNNRRRHAVSVWPCLIWNSGKSAATFTLLKHFLEASSHDTHVVTHAPGGRAAGEARARLLGEQGPVKVGVEIGQQR
jgi:hypothetical protein